MKNKFEDEVETIVIDTVGKNYVTVINNRWDLLLLKIKQISQQINVFHKGAKNDNKI